MAETVRDKAGKLWTYKGTGDRNDKNNWYETPPLPAGTYEPSDLENTIQEMHPDVSVGTRMLLKNLANSPEASLAYIQKEYPQLQVKAEGDQIKMKRPEEKDWRVLDPQTGAFSKDILMDVGDVGYDTLAGLLSGAAATGGAALAAPSGPGAIAAGATAGGASSAALEALRQKLGQKAGIPQEVSGSDVALQGAIGTAAPALLGTGASKSLLMEGLKKTAPAIMEASSGVPKEAISAYFKSPKAIDTLAKEGVNERAEVIHEQMRSGLARGKQLAGEELQNSVEAATTPVNISKAKQRFDDLIAELEKKPGKNSEDRAVLQGLKAKRNKIFEMENPDYEDQLREYKMSKEAFDEEARVQKLYEEAEAKRAQEAAAETQEKLKKTLEQLGVSDKNGELTQILKDTGHSPEAQAALLRKAGVDEQTITQIIQPTKTDITYSTKSFQMKEPPEFIETPDDISAAHAFSTIQERLKEAADYDPKSSLLPRNSTEDVVSKRIKNAAAQAYQDVNQGLEEATQGWSKQAKDTYKRFSTFQRTLDRDFSSPEKTYKTLSNIYGGDKRYLMKQLDDIKAMTGGEVDLTPAMEEFAAVKTLGDAPWMPYSSKGTTSTSRTAGGGAAGALLGGGVAKLTGQSPFLGATAGGAIGAVAGGPKAIKAYIKAGKALQQMTPEAAKRAEPALLLQQYLKNKSEEE
jgi:hypothetical protein